uniref:Uncharacterized protein n=1 Tax=Anguilla anguilla TaxID=7936 RepID=A0A0E9XPQ7_ANGAN
MHQQEWVQRTRRHKGVRGKSQVFPEERKNKNLCLK